MVQLYHNIILYIITMWSSDNYQNIPPLSPAPRSWSEQITKKTSQIIVAAAFYVGTPLLPPYAPFSGQLFSLLTLAWKTFPRLSLWWIGDDHPQDNHPRLNHKSYDRLNFINHKILWFVILWSSDKKWLIIWADASFQILLVFSSDC